MPFGHKELLGPWPRIGVPVTSKMLWPPASTNCGDLRSQNFVCDFKKVIMKYVNNPFNILNYFIRNFTKRPDTYYIIIFLNSQAEFCDRRSSQLVVARGHNIFEVTRTPINRHRLLWPDAKISSKVT